METYDVYKFLAKYPEELKQAENMNEFLNLIPDSDKYQYMKKYANGWINQAYKTARAGKTSLYNALSFNAYASKFSDLFESITFCDTKQKPKTDFYYLGGNASLCGHYGGMRGWSKTSKDIRSHYGANFFGTYAKPTKELLKFLGTGGWSFEAIRRSDGILITVHDSSYIGSTWLALLDDSEQIETYFDITTLEFLETEKQAAAKAWELQP